MAYPNKPEDTADALFDAAGNLRPSATDPASWRALQDSLNHTRTTHWDSVRTPHLFMGLLSSPDPAVFNWANRLNYDTERLYNQFRELFAQDQPLVPPLKLNREFLSDNVIRALRDAHGRASDYGRTAMTQMDLLITLFTAPHSIVAECFSRVGVTAAQLTELAVLAEQDDHL